MSDISYETPQEYLLAKLPGLLINTPKFCTVAERHTFCGFSDDLTRNQPKPVVMILRYHGRELYLSCNGDDRVKQVVNTNNFGTESGEVLLHYNHVVKNLDMIDYWINLTNRGIHTSELISKAHPIAIVEQLKPHFDEIIVEEWYRQSLVTPECSEIAHGMERTILRADSITMKSHPTWRVNRDTHIFIDFVIVNTNDERYFVLHYSGNSILCSIEHITENERQAISAFCESVSNVALDDSANSYFCHDDSAPNGRRCNNISHESSMNFHIATTDDHGFNLQSLQTLINVLTKNRPESKMVDYIVNLRIRYRV